jgi:hypothetical protein
MRRHLLSIRRALSVKSTDGLVEELVRAADDRNGIADQEKQKLLERAIDAIRGLRDQIHRWPGRHVIGAVDGLAGTAALLKDGQCPQSRAKAALVDAADMIRDLLSARESGIQPDVDT